MPGILYFKNIPWGDFTLNVIKFEKRTKERFQLYIIYKIILHGNVNHIKTENHWIHFLLFLERNINFGIGLRGTYDFQIVF